MWQNSILVSHEKTKFLSPLDNLKLIGWCLGDKSPFYLHNVHLKQSKERAQLNNKDKWSKEKVVENSDANFLILK